MSVGLFSNLSWSDLLASSAPQFEISTKFATDHLYREFEHDANCVLLLSFQVPPERKEMITMFFSDVVGFTDISSSMSAEKVFRAVSSR